MGVGCGRDAWRLRCFEGRYPVSVRERESLVGLRRGVFARRALPAGTIVRGDDIFLSIPEAHGQVTANDLSKYTSYTLKTPLPEGGPVLLDEVEVVEHREQVG